MTRHYDVAVHPLLVKKQKEIQIFEKNSLNVTATIIYYDIVNSCEFLTKTTRLHPQQAADTKKHLQQYHQVTKLLSDLQPY